jgi:hypothetical protein
MISNGIVHCLNALGIVAKVQRFYVFVRKKTQLMFSKQLIDLNFDILCFRYKPLCMSLCDEAADYSWSG